MGKIKWLFFFLFASLPWSVDIAITVGMHLVFPTEILVIMAAIVLLSQGALPRVWAQLNSATTISLILLVIWNSWRWLSAAQSSLPLVSAKYMIIESLLIFVFGLLPLVWPDIWQKCIRILLYSLVFSVAYTTFRHGFYFHFRADQANLAPLPFFNDHTVYAAVLALAAFAAPMFLRNFGWISILLLTGMGLSTCRGAWLSVIGGLLIIGVQYIFQKRPAIASGIVLTGVLLIVLSMGKISAAWQRDTSMAERWNRYQCALRMAHERPLSGWGPGTYALQYIPFQDSREMTRISLKTPTTAQNPPERGYGGGVHSEYLQALSETGWPGLVAFGGWVAFTLFMMPCTGYRQWLMLAGTWSYWLHGLLNHFLHEPLIAAMVWGFSVWSLSQSRKKP